MNWIRICVGIADDPTVGAIADACDIPLAEAVGCVVSVLCKLPSHAEDGGLSAIPDRTLEKWANWEHERGAFAKAFRSTMCDEAGVVKAWDHYNGAAIREAKASRDRMRETRRKPKAKREAVPAEPFAERSANGATNAPRTFTSNGTGRNENPPPSPDGSVVLPEPPVPHRGRTAAVVSPGTTSKAGPLFAEWEKTLFDAALPHEAAALEALCSTGFRPAIIGELYAIAAGQHLVRGEHAPYREANAADVMRAVSEYLCKGREWNTSYFRGVVRRILDRPAEPPDAAQREQERLAKQVASTMPAVVIEKPRTPEEIEASRAKREAAMRKFREEAMRNTAADAKTGEVSTISSVLPSAVKSLVA